MVNLQSGLPGVSETSSDMRDLPDRETHDVRSAEAAALGGLDTLVFAAGIGENAPTVRTRICDWLRSLGVDLAEERNAADEAVISTAASRAGVRVIRARTRSA